MNSETDEELMSKVKEGYLGSLTVLFERHQKPLFNFFLRMCRDLERSEDLTQSVFERIIKYRKSYKNQHSFRSWMYQLARNLFYDSYRNLKRKNEYIADPQEEGHLFDFNDNQALKEKRRIELNDALSRLPAEQRELILMSKYQGLKYEEISRATGISLSAIKVRIHRAMHKLRDVYFEERKAE